MNQKNKDLDDLVQQETYTKDATKILLKKIGLFSGYLLINGILIDFGTVMNSKSAQDENALYYASIAAITIGAAGFLQAGKKIYNELRDYTSSPKEYYTKKTGIKLK